MLPMQKYYCKINFVHLIQIFIISCTCLFQDKLFMETALLRFLEINAYIWPRRKVQDWECGLMAYNAERFGESRTFCRSCRLERETRKPATCSCCFPDWLTLRPWKLKRSKPPKLLYLFDVHDITTLHSHQREKLYRKGTYNIFI
jgi:hypothetical protein